MKSLARVLQLIFPGSMMLGLGVTVDETAGSLNRKSRKPKPFPNSTGSSQHGWKWTTTPEFVCK
jgi:hypothetical protein